MVTIRLLGPDDGHVLERIAATDADFDLADSEDDGDEDDGPIDPASAVALLSDPGVLYWAAFDGDEVVGMLHCQIIRKHAARPIELLLYDVGVRTRARRHGVGRALLAAMTEWMGSHAVREVWVLAGNPGAVAFYAACGFRNHPPENAVYMTREL